MLKTDRGFRKLKLNSSEKGKLAVVTGASSGIGAAIAVRLASDGFNLALNCHSQSSKTKAQVEVAKKCEAFGVKTGLFVADVSNFEQCKKMVDEIKAQFGAIHCLINNAGTTRDGLLARMSEADFDFVTQVNYKSVFNLCRLVGKEMMLQKNGRIVNITSVVGLNGNVGQFNYCAAKAGVVGMTKALAKELGRFKVLVNAVAPGFVETKMTENLPQNFKDRVIQQISLRRFAKPQEIAGVVSFLCGVDSSYINGQVLVVDGSLAI